MGLGELVRLVREGQFGELARIFGRWVPRGLLYIDVFLVTELRQPAPLGRRGQGLAVHEVRRAEEVPARFPTYRWEIEQRLAGGHAGFLCEHRGDVIGMSWLDLSRVRDEPHKFCRFAIPADGAWGHDTAIVEAWRMSGAMVALMDRMWEYMQQHGRTRMYGYASAHNQASLKAHLSFGFEVIQKVTVVNVLGLRVHRIQRPAGVPPRETRISLFSRPTIDLRQPPSPALEEGRQGSGAGS